MNPVIAPHAPVRKRTRLTPVGKAVLLVGALALLLPGARMVGASALAMVFLAPFLAVGALRKLRAGSPSAACCMAGEDVEIGVPVANGAHVFTARDVTLHHPSDGRDRMRASAFLPTLPAGAGTVVRPVFSSTRRGRRKQYEFVALSTFPFGLAFTLMEFVVPADLLVLPRPGSITDLTLLGGFCGGSPPRRLPPLTDEGDFRSLREWREGESQRLVHWKATARRGRPVVRELVSEDLQPVHVVLAAGIAHIDGRGRATRAFERAVNVAATLVAHFLRKGHRTRLSILGTEAAATAPHRGRRGLYPMLALLAEVEADPEVRPSFPTEPPQGRERIALVVAGRTKDLDGQATDPRLLVLFSDDRTVRDGLSRVPAPGARTVLGPVR